jgi:2-keto-4-pentenoate hydratase/2-oxohepta-3-ene-1,7-dioic acid hydratase in catechol pathway
MGLPPPPDERGVWVKIEGAARMRLVRYAGRGGIGLGLVTAGGIVPIARHLADAPADMITLIAGWEDYRPLIAGLEDAPDWLPLADVSLLAPIQRPGKILGIGLNYKDHIAESGLVTPANQLWFSKAATSISGPFDAIKMPRVSSQLDYEAELVMIIGKTCRYADRQAAEAALFGYCVGNDVSVRDWQFRTSEFMLGKSFDTCAPIGPWIVTRDELDGGNLEITCHVNGEARQRSNTHNLIFNCIDQIVYLSQVMTLEPGDVIFTGTPSGVGAAMKPPKWLSAGDVVRVEIAGIGAIENTVEKD